ncbi:hypothetical protein COCMIDRAFT_22373 [Bipolaris oryzae ATCC 44560]|uniref:Uncharacterized protein n=1 Tax=Bipolaris oryzae ATCC 44560 TaxID=930090 RepID=W7A1Y3_COCMI|nr:uncharacterized protein COCMIDRAFT_22373 [Bipolaris oryzae ATCC 44560]EUC50041.1 hypothetical protein COCMIDRAFT_22373 [Bipolaris oryzae ATCC 44560]
MPYYPKTTSIYSTSSSSEEEHYYIPSRDQRHNYNWDTNQPHTLIPQLNTATTFSTKSPTSLPMTDSSHHHQPIDARALHSRLAVITSNNNNSNETTTDHGSPHRRLRPSLDSTITTNNTLPFTKSSTISTFDSHTSTTSSRLHASPSSRLHPETVGIAPGDFSKPRVPRRSRRYTMESSTSSGSARREREEPAQFKYYGRHGNQWLFNDFSVSGAVAKGFRRVFRGKGEEGKGDWYEDREGR